MVFCDFPCSSRGKPRAVSLGRQERRAREEMETGEKKKKDKKGWADGVRKGSRMGNGQKKRVQQEDFPGGHPLEYYYHPSTFNFRVLMGSGALVLV